MKKYKEKNQRKHNAEKGITLITLVVAVSIMIIISGMLIYNAKSGIKMRNLKMMQNDIDLLDNKVDSYYVKYGALPAEIEYNVTPLSFESVKSPNDNDKYYVLDLKAFEGLTLNYGADFNKTDIETNVANYTDLYVINEQSHHIYYVRGIEMDGVMYYTNDNEEEAQKINYAIIFPDGRKNTASLLEQAVNLAENDAEIKLLKENFTDNSTNINIDKNIYLNLNNRTLNLQTEIIITSSGTLSILDNGTLNMYNEYNYNAGGSIYYSIKNSGTLNVAKVKLYSDNNQVVSNSGIVNISGGTLEARNKNVIYNTSAGTVEIGNSSVLTSSNLENQSTLHSLGAIKISESTIYSENSSAIYNLGNVEITDSNISSGNSHAIFNDVNSDLAKTGTVKIGGTSNVTVNSETSSYPVIYNNGNVEIAGGTILSKEQSCTISNYGKLDMLGGVIHSESKSAIINRDSGTINISGDSVISSNSSDAILIYNYSNLNMTGGTATSSSSKYTLYNAAGSTTSISNGNIHSENSYAIYSNGTLEIGGTANISNTSSSVATLYNLTNGTFTMTGGTLTSENYRGIINNGTLEIRENANINSKSSTIYNQSSGKATITGGTVISVNSIAINNYGTVEIGENANISNNATNYATISNQSSGILTISGGTIISKSAVTITNQSSGTLTITGGTITGVTNVIKNYGTLEIGGTSNISNTSSTYPTVYNYSTGILTITGGTIINNDTSYYAVYNEGGTATASSNAVISKKNF